MGSSFGMPRSRGVRRSARLASCAALLLIAAAGLDPRRAAHAQQQRVDYYGDPIPAGAMARLGSVRFKHPGWWKGVAFSPVNNELCTRSPDERSLAFWDIETGRRTATFDTQAQSPQSFVWSPDGTRLAVLGFLRLPPTNESFLGVQIIDRATLTPLVSVRWKGSADRSPLAFTPDGETILVGGFDGTLRVFDLAAGAEVLASRVFLGEINSLAVSPDGRTVAVAGRREPLLLWNWLEESEPRKIDVGPEGAEFVAFVEGAERLLVAGRAGPRLVDAVAGLLREPAFDGLRRTGEGFALSSDRRYLAVADDTEEAVVVWDVATGDRVRSFHAPGRGPQFVAFSADGAYVAAVGSHSAVDVWRFDDGERLGDELPGHCDDVVGGLAFSPDGEQIVTGGGDGRAILWDVATGRSLLSLGHSNSVGGVAFSPDGRTLATSCSDEHVRLWDLPEGRERFRFAGHQPLGLIQRDVRFSPDGTRLASFGADMYLRLWNVANAKALCEHEVRPGGADLRQENPGTFPFDSMDGFVVSRDARRLAVLHAHKVYVYDVESGRETRVVELPGTGQGRRIALSQDGETLLVTQTLPLVQVTLPGGQVVQETPPEGKMMLRAWNLATGEMTAEHPLAARGWPALCLASDGRTLAIGTGSRPGVLQFLDLLTGEELHRIEGFVGRVGQLALSPDDGLLAAGLAGGEVLIWDVAGIARVAE